MHETASSVYNLSLDQKDILEKELGFVSINERLNEIYETYQKKINKIEAMEAEIIRSKLPLLFLEGESDNKHFSNAYKKLFNNDISDKYKLSLHENSGNGSIGDGARLLNNLFFNFISKFGTSIPLIAIFDSDNQGICEFKALLNRNNYEKVNIKSGYQYVFQKKSTPNVIIMLLPIPDYRNNFFDFDDPSYSYVSTELMYKDHLIPPNNRKYPSKNDQSVFSFKGNKMNYANSITDKLSRSEEVDFSGFSLMFNILDEIIEFLKDKGLKRYLTIK